MGRMARNFSGMAGRRRGEDGCRPELRITEGGFDAKARGRKAGKGGTGNLPGSGFGRVARNHRRVTCATRCAGLFMRIADGSEGGGGGFNGGGIPRPASNHLILYLFSMLLIPSLQACFIPPVLTIFARNEPK